LSLQEATAVIADMIAQPFEVKVARKLTTATRKRFVKLDDQKSSLDESSTIASITLPLALIEAQSLRSHALCFLIKCVKFLSDPCLFRFRRIASQFFERFLNRELGGFSHGNLRSLF
jgi:hypothetical protein